MRRILWLVLVGFALVITGCTKQLGPSPYSIESFAGKWKGSRGPYVWEIERFPDETYHLIGKSEWEGEIEVIFVKGKWKLGGEYFMYRESSTLPEEYHMEKTVHEKVESVTEEEIRTLTTSWDDTIEDKVNVEVRVEAFSFPEWKGWDAKWGKQDAFR